MRTPRGFTVIEMLMYLAIMGGLLSMIMNLYLAMAKARDKANIVTTVEEQGYSAMQMMTQATRNAQDVITPNNNATSSMLSLLVYSASSSPTNFYISSSSIYMDEGSTTTAITNSRVTVSNMLVQDLTASTTDGSVKIQFTVSIPDSPRTTGYSATFYSGATVRNRQ